MPGLPEGWEWDYDGKRWFYKYKPNGHVQYHFPSEGDEFPSYVGDDEPAPDLAPEEKLESQQQMKRQLSNSQRRAPKPPQDTTTANLTSATATQPVSDVWDDHGDGDEDDVVFQPENFMFLGPTTYTDISPLADEEEEAAKRAVAGGSSGIGERVGVSPLGSGEGTPMAKNSEVATSPGMKQVQAHTHGGQGEVQEVEGVVQVEADSTAIAELPVVERFNPVGNIAEMATHDTGRAHVEDHPDPVEIGGNEVLPAFELDATESIVRQEAENDTSLESKQTQQSEPAKDAKEEKVEQVQKTDVQAKEKIEQLQKVDVQAEEKVQQLQTVDVSEAADAQMAKEQVQQAKPPEPFKIQRKPTAPITPPATSTSTSAAASTYQPYKPATTAELSVAKQEPDERRVSSVEVPPVVQPAVTVAAAVATKAAVSNQRPAETKPWEAVVSPTANPSLAYAPSVLKPANRNSIQGPPIPAKEPLPVEPGIQKHPSVLNPARNSNRNSIQGPPLPQTVPASVSQPSSQPRTQIQTSEPAQHAVQPPLQQQRQQQPQQQVPYEQTPPQQQGVSKFPSVLRPANWNRQSQPPPPAQQQQPNTATVQPPPLPSVPSAPVTTVQHTDTGGPQYAAVPVPRPYSTTPQPWTGMSQPGQFQPYIHPQPGTNQPPLNTPPAAIPQRLTQPPRPHSVIGNQTLPYAPAALYSAPSQSVALTQPPQQPGVQRSATINAGEVSPLRSRAESQTSIYPMSSPSPIDESRHSSISQVVVSPPSEGSNQAGRQNSLNTVSEHRDEDGTVNSGSYFPRSETSEKAGVSPGRSHIETVDSDQVSLLSQEEPLRVSTVNTPAPDHSLTRIEEDETETGSHPSARTSVISQKQPQYGQTSQQMYAPPMAMPPQQLQQHQSQPQHGYAQPMNGPGWAPQVQPAMQPMPIQYQHPAPPPPPAFMQPGQPQIQPQIQVDTSQSGKDKEKGKGWSKWFKSSKSVKSPTGSPAHSASPTSAQGQQVYGYQYPPMHGQQGQMMQHPPRGQHGYSSSVGSVATQTSVNTTHQHPPPIQDARSPMETTMMPPPLFGQQGIATEPNRPGVPNMTTNNKWAAQPVDYSGGGWGDESD